MNKNRLFGLVVVLGILMGFADLGFAVCDCNNTLPAWYLAGTKCPISPYFYKAEIDADLDWFLRNGDPDDSGSVSGSCTEYLECITNNDCDLYSCGDIESTHSWENDSNDLRVGLSGFESDCYSSGWTYWFPGYTESEHCLTGSWDSNNIYTGNESFHGEYYEYGTLMLSEDYTADINIAAVFDRNQVPLICRPDPNITISNYQPTMFVRPKDGCCCEGSNGQLITISCAGAAHIKATMALGGDSGLVIMDDSKWEKGCYIKTDGTRACYSSGWITITPNHDKVLLINNQPKTQTVTYTVDFYDSAGNFLNTRAVTVTLTTKCPPEPK